MDPEAKPYDSIYWVEVDRIKPNPFQPRKVFEEAALQSLSESIRQYGVLQPLVVTRKEIERPGEGIQVEYELISGERRLRASKLAGVYQVPVVIRHSEDSDRMKLELAIIENLQREDLNAIDRAIAFKRLYDEFGLKHADIGKRVGKSREYVSNTMRILMLPKEMQDALQKGDINEGHTRPLLMLIDKPEEQRVLFKEIVERRLTVRDTEQLARRIAVEKVRKTDQVSPDLIHLERQLTERLGTRVRIEKKDKGGKVMIEFFSPEDLAHLCMVLASQEQRAKTEERSAEIGAEAALEQAAPSPTPQPVQEETGGDLYSVKNFTV
ncbi:ParB/RepB/Spo0J family partition protein [Candidatus Kaiserbacteria bacterium]|nr:ParB/RepB/Spo0J family partition protein [Candidatus Kaiserbacteria bacterium]